MYTITNNINHISIFPLTRLCIGNIHLCYILLYEQRSPTSSQAEVPTHSQSSFKCILQSRDRYLEFFGHIRGRKSEVNCMQTRQLELKHISINRINVLLIKSNGIIEYTKYNLYFYKT